MINDKYKYAKKKESNMFISVSLDLACALFFGQGLIYQLRWCGDTNKKDKEALEALYYYNE